MDTTKIKAVLLAAKYKSLSKASEEFSYTPSALSHSVDSLENELGVKILNRSHTGVELSEEGEYLFKKLLAVVEAENELIKSATAISSFKHNRLRIGTYSSISVNLLPEILSGFKQKYPEIEISIMVTNSLSDCLEKGVVDVILGVKKAEYEWLPITRDDFVAVVPEKLFCGRKSISYNELYPYPFIATENLNSVSNFDLKKFKELINITSEDDTAAVSMVQEGMGVTILPTLALKQEEKGIRIIKLEPNIYRTLGLSYKKELKDSSGAMKFIRYLKSTQNINK